MDNLSSLPTETRNPKSASLDLLPAEEIVKLMNEEDGTVAEAVRKALPAVAGIARAAAFSFERGGRLIYMGAGTSGRLGVLDAAECRPTFGVPVGAPDGTVIGLIAGGMGAMFEAVEGAEDSPELGEKDLADLRVGPLDTVVGVAASGRTPYVVGGLTYARSVGAVTGAVSCAKGAKISSLADHAAEAVTGPEVLTGSTRLKAGTAQKMILNMISTAAFVLSGKTFGNLMVDVQATNEKLVDRARRIVMTAVGCGPDEAAALFEGSGHNVKTAVVMGLCGLDKAGAETLLSASSGHIRRAVSAHRKDREQPAEGSGSPGNASDFIIGIDAGGTKTRALAYRTDDLSPIPESETRGGPGNLTYDPEGAFAAISETAKKCAEAALKITGGTCRHLSVGAAGFSAVSAKTAGAAADSVDCPKTFVSDATLALHANFGPEEAGMIVLSGTGSAAFMQIEGNHILRAGGWGNLLGDGGSGWAVSRAAVRELLKRFDAGDPASARAFYENWQTAHDAGPAAGSPFFDGCTPGDLIAFVTRRPKKDLSRLACSLVSLCDAGDPLAEQLAERLIRDELSVLAEDCARLLDQAEKILPRPVPVVLTGGFFESNPTVRRLFREILGRGERVSEWREVPADPTRAAVRHYLEALDAERKETES